MNQPERRLTPVQMVLRLLGLAAIVAGIVAAGIGIYRNQKQSAGMPVAAAPVPRETQAATVEDVITRLEHQVDDTPDDAEAWRTLGWSYFQRDRYADAVSALRRATFIDPTNARTFSFLGEALLELRKDTRTMPHEARSAFDTALRLDPKDARARYYRAVGWDLAGEHRRAIRGWLALLQDTPPDAPYVPDIRAVIRTVGARHHIKVEKALAEVRYVPPGPASVTPAKPQVAARKGSSALPGPIGAKMRAVEGVPDTEPTDSPTPR